MIDNLRKNGFVIVPIEPTGEMLSEAEMASDLRERAHAKRLYDALSAMMYGWEDDSVRTEAFAALKEWDDAEAALTHGHCTYLR